MNIITLSPKDDVQAILDGLDRPATIYLKKGVYRNKLCVRRNDVTIIGEERETTVLSYDDYAKKAHPDGREYNTFRTYTVCVTGERVTLKNLTVENANTAPETVGQCVALSVNARRFRATDVDLKSTQDTLFTAPFPDDLVVRYSGLTDDPAYYDGFIPREQLYMEGGALHLFDRCRIYGTVDFIFGCAEAYFRGCELISLADKRNCGFVAAPAHSLKQERGYTFLDCKFRNGGADGGVFLARPWRDFGKCDFIRCELENHISPLLFDRWNDTRRDKTARFAYYGLKGGNLSPVPWARELTEREADEIAARCNAYFNGYSAE